VKKLSTIVPPFVISVICEPTPAGVASAIENSSKNGASIIELNIAQIFARDLGKIERLIAQSDTPIYTACRRRNFMPLYGYEVSELQLLDDEDRIGRQLQLLDHSVAIDMEFDTFAGGDAHVLSGLPAATRECSQSESSLRRQSDVIDEVHSKDLDVVLSCHTALPLTESETLHLAMSMQERGADVIKIVNSHTDADYCPEIWKTILTLRSHLRCPFVLLSMGPGSILIRRMACHLGCSYTFARPAGVRYFYPEHETIADLEKLFSCFPPYLSFGPASVKKTQGRSSKV